MKTSRSHSSRDALAARVQAPASRRHRFGDVDERELEIRCEVLGVIAAARAELEYGNGHSVAVLDDRPADECGSSGAESSAPAPRGAGARTDEPYQPMAPARRRHCEVS